MCHSENTLPKWAQARLVDLREELIGLQSLRKLKGILDTEKCRWVSINGPHENSDREYTKLWALGKDEPLCVCSLSKGDVLFVGQLKKPEENIKEQ